MAGEGRVISSTEEVIRQVEIFPGSTIFSWEEALGSSGARGVLSNRQGWWQCGGNEVVASWGQKGIGICHQNHR